MKHGRGTDFFANGDQYQGHYKNGKPQGKGVYTWANGSYYEGQFVAGLKCGKGKWKRFIKNEKQGANSPSNQPKQFLYYEGDYENDKKNG